MYTCTTLLPAPPHSHFALSWLPPFVRSKYFAPKAAANRSKPGLSIICTHMHTHQPYLHPTPHPPCAYEALLSRALIPARKTLSTH